MRPFAFFDTRVRGFRVVEIGGLVVLLALILTVYLAKTSGGGKKADIDHVQQQIFDEQTQIRMLRAEVATLEQPERLEDLSARYLHLGPISDRREVTVQALADVARVSVADHKTALAIPDPLTQVGSPDILPPPGAPTGPAAPGAVAPATPAALAPLPVAAAPAAKPAAAQPALKLAQAGPPSHAAKLAAAHPSHAAAPPGADATAQDAPSDDAPVSDR